MNPIDQIADERDKLKAKLSQAKAKLKKSKLRISYLSTQRLQALHTLHNANTANLRARAMICDAAGIPHDADLLEWISGARERIARLEEALDFVVPVCSGLHHPNKHRHTLGEPCPVERIIEEAKKAKP